MSAYHKDLEKILKALANRRRIAILAYLKKHSNTPVYVLAEEINLSLKATSKHLMKLSSVRLVEYEQKSLNRFYSLTKNSHTIAKHLLSLL